MKERMVLKTAREGPDAAGEEGSHQSISSRAPVVILPSTREGSVRVEGYSMPEVLYYHQGHSWVALQENGTAVIGIDDFAGKLIGKPDSMNLPRVGKICRQGEKAWSLRRNGKTLDILCPLDGEVIAVNGRAIESPEVLINEPYGSGWLLMVKTRDVNRNLRNLLRGSMASKWMEESARDLRAVFSGDMGLVYQDGGLPEPGLCTQFDSDDWEKLVSRMFMLERKMS
jgi:glycine cleavage system H protein